MTDAQPSDAQQPGPPPAAASPSPPAAAGKPLLTDAQKAWLFPIAFCVGGLILAHHSMILSGFAVTQGDMGDARFTELLLEHAWRWLIGDPLDSSYWSPPYFYPQTGHLAWNENMFGAAVLYFPFRVIGMRPDNAYQAWILATGALNFTATFFLFRRAFKLSLLASSVGAVLFAFSANRINQTMHWQLFPHYFTAWAAHAMYRLVSASRLTEQQRVRWLGVLAFSVVGQLWASIYLGWFLVFVLVVGIALGLFWTNVRREAWALVKAHPYTLVLTAAVSAAALYPLAWHYGAVAGQFGGRPYHEVLTMLPMARVWLHMGQGSWFWGSLASWPLFQRIPMEHEQRCGFGLIATALAAGTFIRYRKEPRVVFVGVLLFTLLLVTTLFSADGTSLWRIVYEYFPGAQAIRAVSRAAQTYMLGIATGAALGLDALEKNPKAKWMALPLGALLFFEQGYDTGAFSKQESRRDVAAVAAAIEPGCDVFLMSPIQGYGPYWKYQNDAMLAALEANVPTVNGYGGQNPPGWGLGDTNLHTAQDEARVAHFAQQWFQSQPKLQGKKPCWARVGFNEGNRYSNELVSQQVPSVLKAGQTAEAEIVFKNLGPQPWPLGVGIRLGSEAPADNTQWGTSRIDMPHATEVGQTVAFRFAITAPPPPGKYAFQWRMVHDNVQWLGVVSKIAVVEVVPAEELPPAPADADAGR